ncbi:MAG: hypothetical protein AAGA71_00425 [Pseudomonadota bacterium]
MKPEFELSAIDVTEIEREARRLRAEAMRAAFKSLGAWMRSHLSFGAGRTA